MTASQLGPKPLEATAQNVRRGLEYLRSLNSEGGTMMIEGIKAALDFPHDPERLRFVVFLTDGYIGNEVEILREVRRRLGMSRIFSFGVGASPNRYLLDSMAWLGRGAVAYLSLKDDAAGAMEEFFDRISHPALTDVQVDWDGATVEEVFPARVPDLFVGRPVILTGRFDGEHSPVPRLTGHAGSRRVTVPVNSGATTHPALASVWARMKIAALSDRSLLEEQRELGRHIKQVALDYDLISAFTSFVAVDSLTQTRGGPGTTVPVAVPVPQGVNYKTTVQE